MREPVKKVLDWARAEHLEHVMCFEEALRKLIAETGIPIEDMVLVTEWKGIDARHTIKQKSTGRVLFTGTRCDSLMDLFDA